jgi:hypothetical protein
MTLTVTIRCDANQLGQILHPDATVRVIHAGPNHLTLEAATTAAQDVSDAHGTAMPAEPETSREDPTPSTGPPGTLEDQILAVLEDGPASTRIIAAELATGIDQVRDTCRALHDGGQIRSAGNAGWKLPRVMPPVDHQAARARAAEGI